MIELKIKSTTTADQSDKLSISKDQIFKLNNSKLIELTKSMIETGEVTTSLDFATKFMFSLDSQEKFPLNIELLIEWKVYDLKGNAKTKLIKNFTKDIDYQVTKATPKKEKGGSGMLKENIMLTVDCFKSMCLLSQSRNKITDEIKEKLKNNFGIILDTKIRFTPIETETISYIMKAFNGHLMKTQYQIGVYRIDLYFEIHKLAVECDENGHIDYNSDQEIIRENYIKDKLKCKFIRYNPDIKDFCIFSVINLVMNHIYK